MKKKIYSALIGIGLVSLTLGIWGGVTMYKNRQATELIIQARNEERQKAEAESQTAAEEEIGIAPAVQAYKRILKRFPHSKDMQPLSLLPLRHKTQWGFRLYALSHRTLSVRR